MKITGYQDTIDWYNKNAKKYSKSIETLISYEQIKEFVSFLKKDSLVLDAGCAAGRDSYVLYKSGVKVIGIDLSGKLIEIAKNNFPKIEFVIGDFRKLPFNNDYFDGIWSHASLVHFDKISDVDKSLSEFYRVLKQGGIIHIFVKKKNDKKFEIVSDKLSKDNRFFQYFLENEISSILNNLNFKIISIKESDDPAERNQKWIVCLAKK